MIRSSQSPVELNPGMTKLRAEVLPPQGITVSPDGSKWTDSGGKTGMVSELDGQKIYVPQGAVDRVTNIVQGARSNAEGAITRIKSENPSDSDPDNAAKAANVIATRAEVRGKVDKQPEATEVKRGEIGYTTDRKDRLTVIIQESAAKASQKIEDADLQAAVGSVQTTGGDAILYHLGRVQLMIEKTRAELKQGLNPDGTFKKNSGAAHTWQELQQLEATRNVMERQLLAPEIIRRADRIKQDREGQKKTENAKLLLVENMPNPAKYEAMVADYQKRGLIDASEAKQRLDALTQRFGDFTLGHEKKGMLDKSTAQKSLEADRESRDRWLFGGKNKDKLQQLLADFATTNGLSTTQLAQLTAAERQIFSDMATSRLELARLAAFEKYDPKHALEITEAKKLYLTELANRGVENKWNQLKKNKGWK